MPALQMIEAREDDKIAFLIKVFIFVKLVHSDSFSDSTLRHKLYLNGDSSYADVRWSGKSHSSMQSQIKTVLKCDCNSTLELEYEVNKE
jgi:hypothetical protein